MEYAFECHEGLTFLTHLLTCEVSHLFSGSTSFAYVRTAAVYMTGSRKEQCLVLCVCARTKNLDRHSTANWMNLRSLFLGCSEDDEDRVKPSIRKRKEAKSSVWPDCWRKERITNDAEINRFLRIQESVEKEERIALVMMSSWQF